MPKGPYMPQDDAGKDIWLQHFTANLPANAATVGVSTAEVTAVQADSTFFHYSFDAQQRFVKYGQDWTAYKNAARNGTGPALGPIPVAPVLAAAPAMVAPGIFSRIAKLCARIKNHPGYTEAIGRALDIVGAEQADNTAAQKPPLKIEMQAGHPNIIWPKQGMDGVEIHVDRDGKGFIFLTIDTVPNYLDTAALPAPGQSAVWKYKAIYRLNDEQVGQWSDVVSVTVAG
jgi:hypothetical protein